VTRYWYLVASLPSIAPGAPPPMTTQRFRTLCSEHLVPKDLVEFDAVLAGGGRSGFARAWVTADVQIRNAIARARAARHGVDAERFVRPSDAWDLTLARRVQDALSAQDPGERERQLDDLRCDVARELARAEPFSLETVLAYAIELAIVERRAARDVVRGRAALALQLDALVSASPQSAPPNSA